MVAADEDDVFIEFREAHGEDSDDFDFLRQIDFVRLADMDLPVFVPFDVLRKSCGRMDEKTGSDAEADGVGETIADERLAFFDVEFAVDHGAFDSRDFPFAGGIDAVDDFRLDDLLCFAGQRARLDLYEGGVLNQRGCLDAMLFKDFDDFLRFVHRRFHVREDVEMGLPAHDVLLNILSEARHDGIDDEKDGDAKRRAEDGE